MATLKTQADVRASVDIAVGELLDRAHRGTQTAIQLAERHAKRLAPVRKVSYIERVAPPRDLTAEERRHLPRGLRGIAGLKTTDRRSTQYLPTPKVVESKLTGKFLLADPEQASFLSGRGLSELREQGRTRDSYDEDRGERTLARRGTSAIYQSRVEAQGTMTVRNRKGKVVDIRKRTVLGGTLGGRLRGEIRPVDRTRGGRIAFDLISPTPYAQFVEFPTTRTAAQPYMRPTLAYMEKHFPIHLARAMRTGR